MNHVKRFNTYKKDSVWWMIDPEFEEALQQVGLGSLSQAKDWIKKGDPSNLSSTRLEPGRGVSQIIPIPGRSESLHLRRMLHGGLLAPLWRGHLAGVGRVRKELEVNSRLRQAGAPVPQPVFGMALRSGALWKACFATIYLPETQNANQWLSDGALENDKRRVGIRAIATSIAAFHAYGGKHPDLNAGNILVDKGGSELSAWIIDLDKVRVGTPSHPKRHRELKRLIRSIQKEGNPTLLTPLTQREFIETYEDSFQKKRNESL